MGFYSTFSSDLLTYAFCLMFMFYICGTFCKMLKSFRVTRRSYNRVFSTQPHTILAHKGSFQLALSQSLKHPDYFGVNSLFTVKDLIDARVHFGHKEGSLNNHMKPFLYGMRLGHCIFDLDMTAYYLRQALNFCAHIAFRDGVILFVCRNAQFTNTVENTAKECKEFAHTRYWRNGTFTNSTFLFNAVTRLPDLCIFLSTLNECLLDHPGVTDAAKMNIPSIAIVDSNSDPKLVTYPVPGNDDSPSSNELYCRLFKDAILKGKAERLKMLHE